MSHAFYRSKLKQPVKLDALIAKIAALVTGKKNAFNVDYKGAKFYGENMTNLDFTTTPTKITFTYNSVNYELLKTNIKMIKRIRSRKYMFETNVLTVV